MDGNTRKRGRPRVDPADTSPSIAVCVRLPGALYAKAHAEAQRNRTTVQGVIRRRLRATWAPTPAASGNAAGSGRR